MTRFETIASATLFAAAAVFAGSAQAGEGGFGAQWTPSGGGDADIVWSEGARHVTHGGGIGRLVGSGENARVLYADTLASGQAPMTATITGSGDNAVVVYTVPAESRPALAGAPALPGQRG